MNEEVNNLGTMSEAERRIYERLNDQEKAVYADLNDEDKKNYLELKSRESRQRPTSMQRNINSFDGDFNAINNEINALYDSYDEIIKKNFDLETTGTLALSDANASLLSLNKSANKVLDKLVSSYSSYVNSNSSSS